MDATGRPFRVYPLEMEDVVMCEMNPLRIVFLSHDGCVSPCVYLNMTKRGLLQRVFCGSSSEIQKVCFGNVREHDFMDIWEKSDYQDFRNTYRARLNAVGNMYGNIGFDMTSMETLKQTEVLYNISQRIFICLGDSTCFCRRLYRLNRYRSHQ